MKLLFAGAVARVGTPHFQDYALEGRQAPLRCRLRACRIEASQSECRMNATVGAQINDQRERLAKVIVDEQWPLHPDFGGRSSNRDRRQCMEDVAYTISFLSEAIAAKSPKLFGAYIEWVQGVLQGRDVPTSEFAESLKIIGRVVGREFPHVSDSLDTIIEAGVEQLSVEFACPESSFDPKHSLSPLARRYLAVLRQGGRAECSRMILAEVERGTSVQDVYTYIFKPTQREIGLLWQTNEMSVAEEHYCTAATQLIMSQLFPYISQTGKIGRSMVASCVGGELHEIGLRMVADFFEMAGWDSYYLGSNMPLPSIVRTVRERKPDLVTISATMTFHVSLVRDLVRTIREELTERQPLIMVGGSPFNIEPNLWESTGADGCAPSASGAVELANKLLGRMA